MELNILLTNALEEYEKLYVRYMLSASLAVYGKLNKESVIFLSLKNDSPEVSIY
jgi:hypothetical protein